MDRAVHRGAAVLGLALAALSLACEPKLVVGKWSCAGDDNAGGEGNSAALDEPITAPWSTGFENGFCDYLAAGFCYAAERAAYETVTTPAHSGRFAAAFSVVADGALDGYQTRCVRQGELPAAAHYSAYFFIPVAPSAGNNWNLLHFRGGDGVVFHGLWDVTLAVESDGTLSVVVFDHLRQATLPTTGLPAVPVGAWFQLEVYLQRAADDTGAFAVYQDGALGLELLDLSTDDSSLGQWYVGNLAASLTPSDNTLYVDDVSIRPAP